MARVRGTRRLTGLVHNLVEVVEVVAPRGRAVARVLPVGLLPPPTTELATRDELSALETRLSGRIDRVEQRFDALEQRLDDRFTVIDQRFDAQRREWDERFEAQGRELDARFDGLRDELLAAFRGELVAAVSGQTRAVIVATATAVFGLGGLALSLAQLL